MANGDAGDAITVRIVAAAGYGDGHAATRRAVTSLEVGDQVVVVVSMRSGQRCILRCEAANTAAGTSTILAK